MNNKNMQRFFIAAMMVGSMNIFAGLISQTCYNGYLPYSAFDPVIRNDMYPEPPLHRAVSSDDLPALKAALANPNTSVQTLSQCNRHIEPETALYRLVRFIGYPSFSSSETRLAKYNDMMHAIIQAHPNRRLLEEPGTQSGRAPAQNLYGNLYETCRLEQEYKGKPFFKEFEEKYGQQCRGIRDLILELRKEGHLK